MAKRVAAAVARNFEAIIKLAFATNEFATPVAGTAFGAGDAQSTLADVADFHRRGGNDAFTFRFAPPEVQVGFVLDANHRGHSLFALFEEHVVSVGREALVEGLDVVEFHFRQDAPGEV